MVNDLRVVWNVEKEQLNIQKHGIDFNVASLVFNDYYRIELFDKEHSVEEVRYNVIGSVQGRVIFVVYAERKDYIRIISARMATRRESEIYYG